MIESLAARMSWVNIALFVVLLCGAGWSGFAAISAQLDLRAEWLQLAPQLREDFVLGPYAAAVNKVKTQVAEDEGIVLVSGIDPALLPYALFPRKIWQKQVDPETNATYMTLPPSAYPVRSIVSFPAVWLLIVQPGNLAAGGDLVPLQARRKH